MTSFSLFTWIEAFHMALSAIAAHKLRSLLTLVGIIAGVAAIISIMTGISVVQNTMEKELSVLGATTFQVQKFPVGTFGPNNIDFRKIARREPITVEMSALVREKVSNVEAVGSELWGFGATAKYRNESTNANLSTCGGTPEYPENNTHWVGLGRNITHEDVRVARRIAVIGFNVGQVLFPFTDPIGKEIKVDGHKFIVQGVFDERKSAMGGNFDNYILMPITVFKKIYGSRDRGGRTRSVNMTVRATHPDLLQDTIAETRAVLRAYRGVDPRDEDDFEIFSSNSQIQAFDQATGGVKSAAFVLGIIGLVVAGIGIMNIMLVSVTERTREIGIRKALGAKRSSILLQFLMESVVLCNIGGVIGVLTGFAIGNIVILFTDFYLKVPMEWAVRGLLFCTFVGIVFGMWPAIRAARMAPIDALGYE
ncbi:MAG: ABC transporter permease [Thermoanaerobaculales bacterium]|nr:ABC transporter permease [Thermoanaerobaculales bacterium]